MKKFYIAGFLLFTSILLLAGTVDQSYFFNNHKVISSGDYHLVHFENLFLTGKTGEPVLPYQAVKILLPPGEVATSIEFFGENEILVPGTFKLYPKQPSRPLSDPGNEAFYKNESVYLTDANYPANQYGELTTSYLNGYAIAMSSFTPVKFNPVTGQISYFQQVKIRIHTEPGLASAEALKNLNHSTAIANRINGFVQNPNLSKQYPQSSKSNDDYQLLIITPLQFESDFDDLVDMYTNRGLKVKLVTKETINSTINGSDLQDKIRNFIIQEYQDNNAEFVLLGGDVEHIPYRGFYCYVQSGSGYEDSGIPSDLYYSALDGNWNTDGDNKWGEIGEDDLLPEIAVARFPFSNSSELANMINKSVSYQNSPVLGEFSNALMAGEWLYSNPETYGSDYLELLIGHQTENGYETWGIPEDYNYTKLYEVNSPWSANDLMAEINAGKQFVHHVGHANSSYVAYLSNSDITNANFSGANGIDHNFTLLQSAGCICGAFDDNDCIMEKMVTIQNFAVAVVGNSRYGWFNEGQTEGPAAHLHREMVDAMYHERMNILGAAFMESKIQTAPWVTAPGQWEEGALRWNFYDINILGDPALSVWTDEPVEIIVNHAGVLYLGTNTYEATVTSEGQPMEGFRCSLVFENEIYGTGLTDVNGSANIEVDPISNPGEATLVVTGYNCLPDESVVTIIPAGPTYVHYFDHFVTEASGNNNGLIDFGETISFDMTLENIGSEQADDVVAELTTTNPYITMTDTEEDFGNIAGSSTTTYTHAFAFDVANDIPDQNAIEFELTINWGDSKQEVVDIFFELANAPDMVVDSITVDDSQSGNGNGLPDPGETVDVVIQASNMGHCACEIANGSISSTSNFANVVNANYDLGIIDAGETKQAIFTVEIDMDTPSGTSIDLEFEVEAGAYTAQQTYYLPVGLVFEDFETGDFSAFDWDFGGNANWTITNANPFEGAYSAKSGVIGDDSETELMITMDVVADDEISFFRRVSSEASYDFLRFYMDGVQKAEWAGEENWDEVTFPVSSGTHTFKWAYEKDQSVNSGEDCAWIDYIVFPGSSNQPVYISDQSTANFNIYPNPASQFFTIEYQMTQNSKVSLSLADKLGQEVKSFLHSEYLAAGFYKYSYHTHDLKPGIYLLRIFTETELITKKIIISK
jgi:hypothetical protein